MNYLFNATPYSSAIVYIFQKIIIVLLSFAKLKQVV